MIRKISPIFQKSPTALLIIYFLLAFSLLSSYLYRSYVFSQCVTHKENSATHTHAALFIEQDARQIVIPADLGIAVKCMHPLHTHDATGTIHMETPLPLTFYLGDFFDVMGIIMNDHQVGSLRTANGYKIEVIKNKMLVKDHYRDIVLKNFDSIKIHITSPR